MKKFKMPSLLKAYKELNISKAKMKAKSYILNAKKAIINGYKRVIPKKYPKVALVVILMAAAVLGSTAYYSEIMDSTKKDPIPYVEVKTVPSAIPEAPDVIGTSSFPVEQNKVPNETYVLEEKPNFISPADGEVIREFGFNYSKTYKDYRFHDGIDIEVPQGTFVQAPADGKVAKIAFTDIEKYTIVIDHGSYLQTHYKHLCEVNVAKGDTIKQGQQIGKINSADSHLHFGITYKGNNEDPIKYLEELTIKNQ